MNNGIGKDRTREDHRELSNQLYACYAEGRDVRKLVAIVGEDALTDLDRQYLKFADDFEARMLNQGNTDRGIEDTLDLGWELLRVIPQAELRRVSKKSLSKYFTQVMEEGTKTPYY